MSRRSKNVWEVPILGQREISVAWRTLRQFSLLCLMLAARDVLAFEEGPVARAVLLRVAQTTEIAESVHQPLPPASLAKLALAVVALESDAMRRHALVRVSAASARQTGSRLGLREGERIGSAELLAATLIASANDACHALAEHVAGSAQKAVVQMNALAQRLGMAATVFVDPCGLDRPGQRTTAADLERLADVAIRQPRLLELVGTREMRIASAAGRQFALKNTNRLLGSYRGAAGLKTGYTASAGSCLIALARRDGVEVLLIMLAADNRWEDAAWLLDSGFARARQGKAAGT